MVLKVKKSLSLGVSSLDSLEQIVACFSVQGQLDPKALVQVTTPAAAQPATYKHDGSGMMKVKVPARTFSQRIPDRLPESVWGKIYFPVVTLP